MFVIPGRAEREPGIDNSCAICLIEGQSVPCNTAHAAAYGVRARELSLAARGEVVRTNYFPVQVGARFSENAFGPSM